MPTNSVVTLFSKAAVVTSGVPIGEWHLGDDTVAQPCHDISIWSYEDCITLRMVKTTGSSYDDRTVSLSYPTLIASVDDITVV
jgi:hypothetical protein